MNVPSPPTDNLYKFIAITGVVLAIVSLVLLEQRYSRQMDLDIELSIGKKSIEAAVEFQYTSNNLLPKEFAVIDELSGEGEDAEQKANKLKSDYYFRIFEDVRRRLLHMNRDGTNYQKKLETAEGYRKTNAIVMSMLGVAFIVGCFLASWGFSLWYRRLQKYQDIIVLNEAVNREVEDLANEPKEPKEPKEPSDG